MFELLFLDLDDTILDFHKAERVAIAKTLSAFGLEPTEEVMQRYHVINKWHWEQLELGNLTRDQVLTQRFGVLLAEYGLDADTNACAKRYMDNLSQGHFFLPGALEAIQRLSGKYRLFLISNGTSSVQRGRLDSAQLYPYFEEIFISHEIGVNKPAKAFFDICFSRVKDFDPTTALVVGDSLSSDIRGGNNAGIATCWVNPKHAPCPADIHADYQIESITQLEAFLEALDIPM